MHIKYNKIEIYYDRRAKIQTAYEINILANITFNSRESLCGHYHILLASL